MSHDAQAQADAALIEALRRWHTVVHGEAPDAQSAGLPDSAAQLFDTQENAHVAWSAAHEAKEVYGDNSPEYHEAVDIWLDEARKVAAMLPARQPAKQASAQGGPKTGAVTMIGHVGQVVSPSDSRIVLPPGFVMPPGVQPGQQVVLVPQPGLQPQSVIQAAPPVYAPPAPTVIAPAPSQRVVLHSPKHPAKGKRVVLTHKRHKK